MSLLSLLDWRPLLAFIDEEVHLLGLYRGLERGGLVGDLLLGGLHLIRIHHGVVPLQLLARNN
jgi:hypothetical protein